MKITGLGIRIRVQREVDVQEVEILFFGRVVGFIESFFRAKADPAPGCGNPLACSLKSNPFLLVENQGLKLTRKLCTAGSTSRPTLRIIERRVTAAAQKPSQWEMLPAYPAGHLGCRSGRVGRLAFSAPHRRKASRAAALPAANSRRRERTALATVTASSGNRGASYMAGVARTAMTEGGKIRLNIASHALMAAPA